MATLFFPDLRCDKSLMSKKTLNAANLKNLGADRLADLLMEVSTGSAEIKRRLRLELSHNLGPQELAHDVRKRLAAIRKSKSFVGWRKRKSLIRDLGTQADMITQKIAPDAPAEAFDLLWSFIELAPSVYERVDDSRGEVGDVFREAKMAFEQIGPRAEQEPKQLAARIWEAVQDNGYGQFDGIVPLLAPTLGDSGLDTLKTLIEADQSAPEQDAPDHAALRFLRELRGTGGPQREGSKARLRRLVLQDIAEAQGDSKGYIAQYTRSELKRPIIAAEVARLLMAEGNTDEALSMLEDANPDDPASGQIEWDQAYIDCLSALDQIDAAQEHRWAVFAATLHTGMLRDHLKRLPDFEDIEIEDRAKALAQTYDNAIAALMFFLDWSDLIGAAELIEARASEMDGDLYQVLAPAAERLRERHPLAAVLLWRSMIEHALWDGKSTRYGHTADHVMDCTAADMEITDYGRFQDHDAFMEGLRQRHKHKASFWARLP
ncbi:hypothetical protein Z946_3165 [Sulfitobacter noctilucicola]|nr:hypothetical protein Z946_3165 [Sulfitobacter noctilucicola]